MQAQVFLGNYVNVCLHFMFSYLYIWGVYMENFKERLKQLRTDLGISQSVLAKEIGVTRAAVNAWELGKGYPNVLCLVALARYLNISTDYLLGLNPTYSVDISTMPPSEREIVLRLVSCFNK